MTSIGSFTKQDDGFSGTLRTLAFSVNVRIVPIPKSTENGPDYRVLAGPTDYAKAGVMWSQMGCETGVRALGGTELRITVASIVIGAGS